MSKIIGSDRVVIWVQPDGLGTPFVPFVVGEKSMGMSGKTLPGSNTTPVYSRDANGRPVLVKKNLDVPGATPSATLSVYERAQIDVLRKAQERGCPIIVQSRITTCGSLINPNTWTAIDHWSGGIVGDISLGDAPQLGFDGTEVSNEAPVNFDKVIRLLRVELATLTTTETEDLLDISGLKDEQCNSCGNGYPGADKILFVGAAAAAAALPNVLVSTNGGGTFTAMTNAPFAADEDVSEIESFLIGNNTIRVLIATDTTDAGAKAKFAYVDVNIGDELSGTFTNVLIAGTAVGDVITAFEQLTFERLYIATTGGDIYVSTDRGETDPGTAVFVGSNTINGFSINADGSEVWAFGATNTLLLEKDGNGVFSAKTAPSGGADFTALTVADDGIIYAGNGTSIYKSIDGATIAGNWTELKDFGTNMVVKSIQCVKGDSQLLRVVVDNTAGAGSVWFSLDGGATWNQVTAVTNLGYNASYVSDVDANLQFIVGDASGGIGLIQKLAA